MPIIKSKEKKDEKVLTPAEPAAIKIEGRNPYMTKGIYNNYAEGMKKKNQKRHEQGLKAIYIRSFKEWATG